MTYGHWLDQTGSRVRRGATAIQRLPADAGTILAVTDARSPDLPGAGRNVELLIRHPYLRQPSEPHAAGLYAALRQAADGLADPGPIPVAAGSGSCGRVR